ncbi:MAG: lipoyl(octanoyl) transferase LipB [Myxococcota bacterium]|nr:lipoyl(octanoyl) transferase LipB [Myxococcota bacterium]
MSLDLNWQWWGTGLAYAATLSRQEGLREQVLNGLPSECLGLLEHREVIPVGKRPVPDLPAPADLHERGIDFHATRRGGLATWHGPGQLVGYLICAVGRRNWTVRGTVASMEEGLIQWLKSVGIQGSRHCGHPGVWVGEKKVGSIGLHFRKGVSIHGFALNLEPAGEGASLIEPCGLTRETLTSVRELTGAAPSARSAAPKVGDWVIDCLPRRPSS